MSVKYWSGDICNYLLIHPSYMIGGLNGAQKPNLPKLLETVQLLGHLRDPKYNRQILIPGGLRDHEAYLDSAREIREELAEAVLDEDSRKMTLEEVLTCVGRTGTSKTAEVITAFYGYNGNIKNAIKATSQARKINVSSPGAKSGIKTVRLLFKPHVSPSQRF